MDHIQGGAIYCSHCEMEIGHGNKFLSNSVVSNGNNTKNVSRGGGALTARSSEVNILGDAVFRRNFASSGGAIYLYQSQMNLLGEWDSV